MIMEDLKTGMLVRTKDNRLRLILSDTAISLDNLGRDVNLVK